MSFWLWSESFLNLIPPGIAPEIQIWHVVEKKKNQGQSNQLSVREEEGRGRGTEGYLSIWVSCGLPFIFCFLFHLLIGFHVCVPVLAWRWLSISDRASRRLTTCWPQSVWALAEAVSYHTVHFSKRQLPFLEHPTNRESFGNEIVKVDNDRACLTIPVYECCVNVFSTFQLHFWLLVKINCATSVIHECRSWIWLNFTEQFDVWHTFKGYKPCYKLNIEGIWRTSLFNLPNLEEANYVYSCCEIYNQFILCPLCLLQQQFLVVPREN